VCVCVCVRARACMYEVCLCQEWVCSRSSAGVQLFVQTGCFGGLGVPFVVVELVCASVCVPRVCMSVYFVFQVVCVRVCVYVRASCLHVYPSLCVYVCLYKCNVCGQECVCVCMYVCVCTLLE